MPTYEWSCREGHEWDVVTTVAQRDEPSICSTCNKPGLRGFTLPQIDKIAAGDWNRVEYNPGLGQWTNSRKHARQIAKAKGLEEVGNESPETIHKHYDKQRKETNQRRWAEVDREKIYD